MNKQQKLELIGKVYTTMKKGDKNITILDTNIITDMGTQNAIQNIQFELDVSFELSYEIMSDACYILSEKTLNTDTKDQSSLYYEYLDFTADADSNANIYTSTQLSYLSNNNESEISDLMNDEAITSIAKACSIWYSRKVAEACEALKDYILQ